MVESGQAPRRFVSYLRVSTDKQGVSGLGLEGQRALVAGYVASVSGRIVLEFREVMTGKKSDRPQLAAALEACRKHRAVLVISVLDRLSRKVAFISNLMESGVPFIVADRPNATPFELHIYASMAEEEGRKIRERTKAALAAAKARGVTLGGVRDNAGDLRPHAKQGATASAAARTEKATVYAMDKLAPVIAELDPDGSMSLGALARALTAKGTPTPGGGKTWQAVQVQRVKARLAEAG